MVFTNTALCTICIVLDLLPCDDSSVKIEFPVGLLMLFNLHVKSSVLYLLFSGCLFLLIPQRAQAQNKTICESTGRGASGIVRSGYVNYDNDGRLMRVRVCLYKDRALVAEQDSPSRAGAQQFAIAGYCRSGGSGSVDTRGAIDSMTAFSLWNHIVGILRC